ncbi:MAG TPA: phosphonatase-like hydrolase [Gemmatimonadaceae bacterium]
MGAVELVIFDMAGTTVRDDGQVPAAFTAALAEYGVTVGPEAIRALRGASKREAIRGLLPAGAAQAGLTERAYECFRDHLARRFADTAQAVPGACDVIARLRSRGIRVALNTGFDRDTTRMLVAALGWDAGTVDAIVCGDDVPQGRPAPYMIFRCMEATGALNVGRVANVGDTVLDLRAGHNAAVRFNVGVLTGAHGRDLLAAEPHTHLLASVADLPAVLADAW